jgi:hypothetical protein
MRGCRRSCSPSARVNVFSRNRGTGIITGLLGSPEKGIGGYHQNISSGLTRRCLFPALSLFRQSRRSGSSSQQGAGASSASGIFPRRSWRSTSSAGRRTLHPIRQVISSATSLSSAPSATGTSTGTRSPSPSRGRSSAPVPVESAAPSKISSSTGRLAMFPLKMRISPGRLNRYPTTTGAGGPRKSEAMAENYGASLEFRKKKGDSGVLHPGLCHEACLVDVVEVPCLLGNAL